MTVARFVTLHDEQPARGFWDQATLLSAFDGWEIVDDWPAPGSSGAVVVVPGRMNYDREHEIAHRLAGVDVAALVVTSDEEGRFSWQDACPHARSWWVQTPTRPLGEREWFVPLGAPPHPFVSRGAERDLAWCFAGQVTHDRRRAAVDATQATPGGLVVASDRFGAGLPPDHYTALLGRSRAVLCPSGPVHVDTFRMYEALEAGAVPVCDARTPDGRDWWWWWDEHYPDRPFPVVDDWAEWPDLAPVIDGCWQERANRAQAWWLARRRDLAAGLFAAAHPDVGAVAVVVTMSPIPSHPDIGVLAETVDSIIRLGPARAQIIVACDGVRPDDEHRRAAYDQAIARLLDRALHDPAWRQVDVVLAPEWVHQANLFRLALDRVHSAFVLFAEHDTPLVESVPWMNLAGLVADGHANVVRLAHEAHVLDEHRYLMEGDGPTDVNGTPVWRTRQFSARPHLASVDWYRDMLDLWFPTSCRTYIEDRLYGVIVERPWEWSKVVMYCPPGDIKRSTHLDGRAGDPKAPTVFA